MTSTRTSSLAIDNLSALDTLLCWLPVSDDSHSEPGEDSAVDTDDELDGVDGAVTTRNQLTRHDLWLVIILLPVNVEQTICALVQIEQHNQATRGSVQADWEDVWTKRLSGVDVESGTCLVECWNGCASGDRKSVAYPIMAPPHLAFP